MHPLAQQLFSHIRRHELLKPGDRVGVAVSGGIDSVALLRLLLDLHSELGIVLSVVHFNHKLRGAESDGDQQFVADLARAHSLEFLCGSDDVNAHAVREGISVEVAARELRYEFFHHFLLERTSGAEAPDRDGINRSAESAAPPKDPQGLKPFENGPVRDPEGPLSHGVSSAFSKTPAIPKLDKIVTGHTLDDQAETVLMRLIRGTGLTGLSGIHPRMAVVDNDDQVSGEIVRPLLTTRRRGLEKYLKDIGQEWREDSTNADHAFTRNRVRRLLVPLLEKEFNPAVAENLAELAEIARGEEEYWENEVVGWMGTAVHWVEPEWAGAASKTNALVHIGGVGNRNGVRSAASQQESVPAGQALSADVDLQAKIERVPWLVANASVSRPWLLSEPNAVQRRVLKAVGAHAGIPLEFKHVEEILHLAAEEGPAGKELSLPLGWKVERRPEELLFVTPDLRETKTPQDYHYEHELPVPGSVVLHECGTTVEARRISAENIAEYNPDELLDADSLRGSLRVRNWRAGDRFWPAHTKSPKKVKELLQERHVAQPERALWPVAVAHDEIVWMRGFATHATYRTKPGRDAVQISERSLAVAEEQ